MTYSNNREQRNRRDPSGRRRTAGRFDEARLSHAETRFQNAQTRAEAISKQPGKPNIRQYKKWNTEAGRQADVICQEITKANNHVCEQLDGLTVAEIEALRTQYEDKNDPIGVQMCDEAILELSDPDDDEYDEEDRY